jgi:hypothetical protein
MFMSVFTFIVQFNIVMELTEDQQTKHGSTEVKPRAPKYWTKRYLSVDVTIFSLTRKTEIYTLVT